MKTKLKGILTLLLALAVQISFAQEKTISGIVSESSGVLPSVSVIIKGTSTGTETDFDGKYSIKVNTGEVPRLSLYTDDSGESFAGVSGLFWGQADSPNPLISYWEVMFIKGEAIIRTNGSDAEALEALKKAVEANMLYIGVTQTNTDTYINSLSLSGTQDNKIETIITEKYKSLYGNAPIESWTDFRRTGYPNLVPNPNAVSGVNPSKIIPRRFLYPISERQTNLTNYNTAISSQGGHLLDDDLWAFPIN